MSENGIENRSVCMMGKQSIQMKKYDIKRMMDILSISYDKKIFETISDINNIDNFLFFKMIGFKEVHALDCSPYEGADILFDLNKDISLLEHVYNVAKAMENMSGLLAPGGIIIHISPGGGLVDHGFYSFSPSFFFDYYKENNFDILNLDLEFIMQSSVNNESCYGAQSIFSMDCRFFDRESTWENKIMNRYISVISNLEEVQHFFIWCISKKIENIPTQLPIQGVYQQLFRKENGGANVSV